ncbi:MAG TPA: exodeoxyribonuclease V subunit gamma [Jatrophihabitans sp.]|nr:exodeoxyribonuclease V subunit gamma [Jatrophihabitans sp.]
MHRAERADALALGLAHLLAQPNRDPFAPEVVAVPSRGVERWLAQQLSHRLGAVDGDGVCANIRFPLYKQVLDEALAGADEQYRASVEAWAPERLVWPLMSTIDAVAPDPAFRVLALHLGVGADRGRRYAVAAKLARLFGAYASARPDMLTGWAAGRDEQGDGSPLPPDLVWQAQLWRHLRSEVQVPAPAELLDDACTDLAVPGLPERWSVFGLSRMSPSRLQVLAAIARRQDVHLWLHHPSPALWDTVSSSALEPGPRRGVVSPAANPFLASMSRDMVELHTLLRLHAPETGNEHHPGPSRPGTLLGRLQADLTADRPPAPTAAVDGSVTVHACHGRARQVEVLREAILAALAADPDLEPRDVVIMCPDIETFAPLIAASFGMAEQSGGHPAAVLRVKLADRSLQQTNPMLNLLAQVLDLVRSRVTATGLLDLVSAGPVRRAFGFDDDGVERIRGWAVTAGARWGLDAAHRAPYGLDRFAQGTWRAALDRVLLGAAMEEHGVAVGETLPLDDVDSGDLDLAGRFAELLDRVETAVEAMAGDHTIGEWAALLADTVFGLGQAEQTWQDIQVRSELDEVAETGAGSAVRLGIGDVASLLAHRLAGRPTRASFRTGSLTVCTLVPMRSVPHRVVCLLGMDDGAFPRHGISDGDDVLARAPRTGERDVRSEDRQLFLDAIMAAQDKLIVTYTGSDPRSGADVPPCVPLAELLDTIDATTAAGSVVTRHPLQPFDARNFTPGELTGTADPFSFDPVALAGARAAAGPRTPAPPVLARPLPAAATGDVNVDDLIRFFQHPAKGFLRQRLQVSTVTADDDPSDDLPIELDSLEKWGVGDRILRRLLEGHTIEDIARLEFLSGTLPPARLGRLVLTDVGPTAKRILDAAAVELALPATAADVHAQLADGRRLTGTVTGIRGRDILTVIYSSLGAKHRLAAWIQYLALTASNADVAGAVTIGRGSGGARRSYLSGLDAEQARMVLTWLVQLRDRGLTSPLPMAIATSEAYADARRRGFTHDNALSKASQKWAGMFPENTDPEHVLLYGGAVGLDELQAGPLAQQETGLFADETTRFGVLARAVWEPLLSHEQVS